MEVEIEEEKIFDQTEESEHIKDGGRLMDGWTANRLEEYVMGNGYWFMICAGIESSWQRCNQKQVKGQLEHLAAEDQDGPFLSSEEKDEQRLVLCRNDELKYQAQMYNWFPIFKVLSEDRALRDRLNSRCYNTIRLLE